MSYVTSIDYEIAEKMAYIRRILESSILKKMIQANCNLQIKAEMNALFNNKAVDESKMK